MNPLTRFVHISDLHFGPPFVPSAGEAVLEILRAQTPSAVVVTGDLTQRAKVSQFRAARAFFDKVERIAPVFLVPGNHDVPLFRVWERLFRPYSAFEKYFPGPRTWVREFPGVTLVGVDTTHPLLRITNGVFGTDRLLANEQQLGKSPADSYRVVAMHHPLAFAPTEPLRRWLGEKKVDVVLSGHAHASRVREAPGPILVQCGTTTSSRGREPENGANSLFVLDFFADRMTIRRFALQSNPSRFVANEEHEIFR